MFKRGPRPIIGVSGPVRGGGAAWLFTRLAVWRAGGKARRITPERPPTGPLDGLIIGGGADVDPQLYGEERLEILPALREGPQGVTARLKSILTFPIVLLLRRLFSATTLVPGDAKRDRLERELIEQGLQRGIPILGICRGAQLLNVYFGGTLHQHLADFYSEMPQIRTALPRKKIAIEAKSCLAATLKARECYVNALHRQAVNRLGRDIVATARAPNGVIQAIEHQSRPFVLGVQWHPEYMPQDETQQRIFRALVKATGIPSASRRPEDS